MIESKYEDLLNKILFCSLPLPGILLLGLCRDKLLLERLVADWHGVHRLRVGRYSSWSGG